MYKSNANRIQSAINTLVVTNKVEHCIIDKDVMHKPFLKDGHIYYIRSWRPGRQLVRVSLSSTQVYKNVEHVFTSYDFELDEPVKIIASALQIKEQTSRSRLMRSRQKIQKEFYNMTLQRLTLTP